MATMKHAMIGLALMLPLGAASATPAIEPATSVDTPAEQDESRLAESEDQRQCPTSYAVRSYIWIEPKTGREYKMLNFYCPALDEA
jgi:hypothetical protein